MASGDEPPWEAAERMEAHLNMQRAEAQSLMREPPDFEQIARQNMFAGEADVHIQRIAAALRQVWNARGAADIEACAIMERDCIYDDYDYEETIKKLDR